MTSKIPEKRALQDKIALVTGGSRGIGRAIAVALAEAGASTVINFSSSEQQAQEVQQKILQTGGKAITSQADVSDREQVARMIAEIEQQLGTVSILVNNAGIAVPQSIEQMTEAIFDETIKINLKSTFLVTQAVLPNMRKQSWGRIINVSSIAAQTGGGIGLHYATSKAGQLGLTYYYAKNLVKENITVNAIAPALIDTGMIQALSVDPSSLPMGRFGTPEEVADVALMLVNNAFMTGQTINVNAGLHNS
jgi:3-oxoacyl-[acyl-carrier protein] reductase